MSDWKVTCVSCGSSFYWTEKEQQEAVIQGKHAAKDCPEGLDGFCPSCTQPDYDPPTECKSCRVKQDGQRS